MLLLYIKTAWRSLAKNRFSSLINISGLAVGIGVSLLTGLWIWDELSINKHHQYYDRIAKVMQHQTNNGEVRTQPVVPYPLAQELRKNYGGDFKAVVLSGGEGEHIPAAGAKKLTRGGSYFEPAIAEMLSLKMIHGTRDGLKDQSSILLSQSTAESFFGEQDPIGQRIRINNSQEATVTGVYEDLPSTSSFRYLQFIAPWDLYFNNTPWIKTIADPWRPNAFQIYVWLQDNADIDKLSVKIMDEKLKNVNPQLAKKNPALFLHPMSKWKLYGEFKDGQNIGGRVKYVWLFGLIGLFVLLLACINFMNLSTARSEKRAREIGIRKAIGSLRRQLITQFFSESILVTAFSFLLSLVLVIALLPLFNEIAGKQIDIAWSNPWGWLAAGGFIVLTGLIAGSYPGI